MLSWLKRKLKRAKPVRQASEPVRRDQQLNVKVSKDCLVIFAALAAAQDLSKAALLEDMVVERYERALRRGVKLKISNP